MVEYDSAKREVLIKESLALDELDALFKKLSDVKEMEDLVVKIERLQEFHFASIQLLISFKKSMKDHLKFIIEDNRLKRSLEIAGLNNFFLKDES